MNFEELELKQEVKEKIEEKGILLPTQVQKEAIPLLLKGKDLLIESKTGTGKTLCYVSAILSRIEEMDQTKVLVLVPTRELAVQVEREFHTLLPSSDYKTLALYGGTPLKRQIDQLEKNPTIIIGTPGRVIDLLGRKKLSLDHIAWLVVDEVDEMLQMGFLEAVSTILAQVPEKRQTVFLSATVSKEIQELSKKYMNSFEFLKIEPEPETGPQIEQDYYIVQDDERIDGICRVMDQFHSRRTMIFCRTKKNADFVYERLEKRGYKVGILHGDIVQKDREKSLLEFQQGDFSIMIATDLAARGIHVDEVDLIINFNLPENKELYIHRIGRTGRIYHHGRAVSLVTKQEETQLHQLEKEINTTIHLCKFPSYEEILMERVDAMINQIERAKPFVKKENPFTDYTRILSPEDLQHLVAWFLNRDLQEKMNLNYELHRSPKKQPPKRKEKVDREDGIRIFLTIGKKDRVLKKELLDYLEKTAHLKTGDCYHVEVHDKFTFMNVKKTAYDQLLKCCNHTEFHQQIIHIEKAK